MEVSSESVRTFVGQLLRKQRVAMNITQKSLGERAGWSGMVVSLLENGKYPLGSKASVDVLRSAGLPPEKYTARLAEYQVGCVENRIKAVFSES